MRRGRLPGGAASPPAAHGPQRSNTMLARVSRHLGGRPPALPRLLLLCAAGLLLVLLLSLGVLHGQLHQQLLGGGGAGGAALGLSTSTLWATAAAAGGRAAGGVLLQLDEDDEQQQHSLSNVTTDLRRLLAYPHVNECRQCKRCIPQAYVDRLLGNSTSSGSSSLWRLLMPWTWGRTQQPAAAAAMEAAGGGAQQRRRLLGSFWQQQQQAAGTTNDSSSSQLRQAADGQQQQQRRRRRLSEDSEPHPPGWRPPLDDSEPHPPGWRPRLDGVKTHKAWLAREAAGQANTNTRTVPGVEVVLELPDRSFDWAGATYHIGPASLEMDSHKIRTCDVCRGCGQHLRRMPKGIRWMGSSFTHDPGASAGWMAVADTAEAPPRPAAVKVWCVPVPKPGTRVPAVCKPKEIREQLQLLLALQNIAQDCGGLSDLLPRHWVGAVDGVLPGSGGFRVAWDGLWADLAVGVSAENLVHSGTPPLAPAQLLSVLQDRINSTQVVLAAIFDLLFSQCDRHGQNVYLRPDGSLLLIDNDQAFGASWRPCGVDSLFLPGTQKFEVARLGFSYVLKKPEYAPPKVPRETLDPLQLLDYRCHVRGGRLGTHFPRPVARCLKRLAASSAEAIAVKYGYPNELMAAAVRQRAADMLKHGFEWTLRHGWPQNPDPTRYRWAKGCCKMQPAAGSSGGGSSSEYTCSRWVSPDLGWPTDLPVGDPVAIMSWEHNGVDSGSYNLTAEIGDGDGEPPF